MMVRSLSRSHVLILPLVVLVVVLVEEMLEYHLRLHVHDLYLRTLGIMLCYALGFTFAASQLSPLLKRILVRLRSSSRRSAGKLGVWGFLCLCYGLVFYAFLILETQGPIGLMPWWGPAATNVAPR